MVFGAKASQDLFDDVMFRVFGDIPMCLNQRDDILIGGRNFEENNETLEAVLQRAKEFGITFNMSVWCRGTGLLWMSIYERRTETLIRQGKSNTRE